MQVQELTQLSEFAPEPAHYDYDIAIVGAGIAGTTLAAALNDSGLSVALIEAQPKSAAVNRQQVYAISLLSGKIFQGIGVWEQILPKITAFSQIRLSDADYPQIVKFLPEDLDMAQVGYAGEHRVLISALHEFLETCENVTWLCPAQVEQITYHPNRAEISLNIEGTLQTLHTRLVVAADGSKSRIREAAGIQTRGWKYWQSCITTRIKPAKPHNNIAYERFWPSGPFAILPLPENRCNIVWTSPHAEAKALFELDDQQFLAELKRRYGDQMGELELEGKRLLFNVQLMQSDCYVSPRLALIGDAAHCCHPVGGQGLNLGIRDAAALAQVITQAYTAGEEIGSVPVLKRYERWRKAENLTILGFTDFLDRLFSNHWWPIVILRRLGLWGLKTITPVKILALRLMTGLLGRTPQLAQR